MKNTLKYNIPSPITVLSIKNNYIQNIKLQLYI